MNKYYCAKCFTTYFGTHSARDDMCVYLEYIPRTNVRLHPNVPVSGYCVPCRYKTAASYKKAADLLVLVQLQSTSKDAALLEEAICLLVSAGSTYTSHNYGKLLA